METEKVIPTDRKERFSWYLFDLANTSFTVLIVTVLFPRYFSSLADAALGEGLGDVWWGLAGSITMIIIALSSPILGAIADFSGSKKKFLTGYTAVCIIFNLLLFLLRDDIPHFLGVDMWIWAFVLFIISNIGFQGALPFYNAWLPEISDE
jgi:UMF1 family MFS transporter